MYVREDRSIWVFILLNILTCGIYGYVFLYEMARDANILCANDGQETPGLAVFILLSFVTCGIYSWYWYYQLGNRLADNAPRYGLNFQENGTTVLLWFLFGIFLCGIGPYIAMHILIKNMNSLAHVYNIQYGGTAASYQTPNYNQSYINTSNNQNDYQNLNFGQDNFQQSGQTVFCSSCGAQIPIGSRFCTSCGQPLQQ